MAGDKNANIFSGFLFTHIFRTFRISVQPSKLVLGLAAVAMLTIFGSVMDFAARSVSTVGTGEQTVNELDVYLVDPGAVGKFIEDNREDGGRTGVYSVLFTHYCNRMHDALGALFSLELGAVGQNLAMVGKSMIWAFRYHPICIGIFSIFKLIIIALAGGAICRMTAMQFSKGEKPGLTEAIRFSVRNFGNLVVAPVLPAILALAAGILLAVLGVLGNVPWAGEILVSLFLWLPLLLGACITVLLIGGVAGFNLMYPAISYDGMDCFDAFSRAFSYVFSRPWRVAFYSLISAVYGAACYVFVRLFAFLTLWSTNRFMRLSIWTHGSGGENKLVSLWPVPTFGELAAAPAEAGSKIEAFSAFIIHGWVLMVAGLAVAFVLSFYFSANTIIYALIRKNVDNAALEDVYTYSGDIEEPVASPEPEKESKEDNSPLKSDEVVDDSTKSEKPS